MRRSLVLDTVLDVVFRTAVVFSLFLLFAGHNAPGGGFIGGLVAGAALVLRYVAGGVPEVRRVASWSPDVVLGTGLVIAVATGLGGWVWGDEFLQSAKIEVDLPVLGMVKATSALPFDIGVYVVVVGIALAILASLGRAEESA